MGRIVLTDVVHQLTVNPELLDGHDGISRKKEYVPVVVTHIGRLKSNRIWGRMDAVKHSRWFRW